MRSSTVSPPGHTIPLIYKGLWEGLLFTFEQSCIGASAKYPRRSNGSNGSNAGLLK
jgi:hypothetical protein